MNDYAIDTLYAEWCEMPNPPVLDASGRFLAPPQPLPPLPRPEGPHRSNGDARRPVQS